MKQNGFSCISLSPPFTANAFSSSKGVINWNKWCDATHSGELEMTWQLCDRKNALWYQILIAKEKLSLICCWVRMAGAFFELHIKVKELYILPGLNKILGQISSQQLTWSKTFWLLLFSMFLSLRSMVDFSCVLSLHVVFRTRWEALYHQQYPSWLKEGFIRCLVAR